MNRLVNSLQQATWAQRLGLLLAIASYVVLWPGVTEPIMTIKASVNMFGLKAELFNETRSIWETVTSLNEQGYALVAFLIVTFSVVIPVLKGLTILFTWLWPSDLRWRIVAAISKWSMVDVFVVGILVAFLTAKATAEMQATLLDGFWWFLSFCILSIISGQLLAQHRLPK
ncbi:paraquat-inducible protein A [Thalassolituus sp.]|uniref:paraquat-inducible protein A n=1 Tax=Thalassolituus sp. TaxID=2030822 RepID=UPI00243D6BF1|nr:paraquat-inducible protein A [Thalassolituus sp.]MEE3209208.1 paraquat-inducible protein A [Pseudomonadota bacterium]